jgi:hypothetical protein
MPDATASTDATAAPQVSTGAMDFLMELLTKGAQFNFPGDKAKLKAFVTAGAEWAKTLTTITANLDDFAIDKLCDIILGIIDSYKKDNNVVPPGGLVVGDSPVGLTTADAQSFMSSFSANDIPAVSREKVLSNPKVLASLRKMSREQQIKVLNSQDLLDMLIKWGPVILKIVMFLITVI